MKQVDMCPMDTHLTLAKLFPGELRILRKSQKNPGFPGISHIEKVFKFRLKVQAKKSQAFLGFPKVQ